MKKIKSLVLLSLILFLGASCEEKTFQEVYSYDVFSFHSSGINGIANLTIVRNYFTEKGCIVTGKIFTADNEADLDKQAIALFDANKAKINIDELASRITEGNISFSYGLVKSSNDENVTNWVKEEKYEINK
ncbi:MAG: hypothetical protein LBV75_07970 [Paludibacter sp.]|jgi:hypothetical protein|nr:hypothetical protein [Paludibacter sp.]